MNTGALRRRVHHEDVGGRRNERLEFGAGADGLDEPLLGQDRYETARASYVDDDSDDDWREKKSREEQAWTQNLSRLIALWAQWFTNAVVGGGAWVGSTLFQLLLRRQANDSQTVEEIYLSPIQAERLENLQQRLSVPFDGSRAEHQDALRALWRSAFPGRALPGLVSEQWKEMGWQGTDPSTDFRGEDEMAFDMLYCVAFEMLDAHWLAMRASYMEFNAVLKATRMQLEREMMLEDVCCVQDLPAFNLLSPSKT